MSLKYAKPERLWLKDHPELDERWLQARIGEDPSLLGLGDIVLKDKERPQPRAGRLDLLCLDQKIWLSFSQKWRSTSSWLQRPLACFGSCRATSER